MAIINKLAINQFRNLNNQLIEPSTGINVFIGNNAQGKTNFIESIYYLAHNRSFKTKSIKEVVNSNFNNFQIVAYIDNTKVNFEKSKSKTNINIDNLKVKNTSDITKKLPIQIITPDKGFVVGGSPKNKRSYLDWGVFHVEQEFLDNYKTYNKILKNINLLLGSNSIDELDFWFLELAKTNSIINKFRINYLKQLFSIQNKDVNNLTKLEKTISEFKYKYISGWPKEVDGSDSSSIYNYLLKNKNYLLKNKYLNYGLHKANIDFYLGDRSENYLSRGEQKTLSILFWLTQVLMLIENNIKPIVLIDDISSELDNEKIRIILDYLYKLNIQVFITNIDQNNELINYKNVKIFSINNGEIKI